MVDIPDEYMRPEMMAIGDSLYQGVRSLTIKRGMMQLSAPALVAEALGIRHKFSCPDPARPILIDMEEWLKMLPDLDAIRDDLAASTDYWLARPVSPSGRLLFENIAIASATVADLYTDTWRTAHDFLSAQPGLKRRLKKLDLAGLNLGAIVQALNTRFTLNPSGRKAFQGLTQMDMVAARLPKRLLVNIGSNNGLWDIAFEANPRGQVRLRTELTELAARLNALPPNVEAIYFNNLPPPSTVPNLMPVPDRVEWERKPGKGKYYAQYENRFGFGHGTMTSKELQKLDEHVAKVNREAQQILRDAFENKARLHFVDLAAMLKAYNSKHERRTAKNVIKVKDGRTTKTLSNVTTEADFWGGFARGGFMGLDGMHPTVVGYAVMAQEVTKAILAAEPGTSAKAIDFDEAFRRDKLLTDMPAIWSPGLWLWRDVRRARSRGEPDPGGQGDRRDVAVVLDAAARMHRTRTEIG